jgi:hypothetical protein
MELKEANDCLLTNFVEHFVSSYVLEFCYF